MGNTTDNQKEGDHMKRVIAIVEDEKDLNELVKRYLEKEGYEVRSYLTFDEASAHTSDDDVHMWIPQQSQLHHQSSYHIHHIHQVCIQLFLFGL